MKTTSIHLRCALMLALVAMVYPLAAQGPGTALQFDGSTQYVNVGSSAAFDLTSGFTVEAWIKVSSFTHDWQAVVTKGDQTWRLHRNSNTNTMGFGTNNTLATPNDLAGTTPVDDGLWHHVAAVYDGTTKYLYVDGKLDGTSTPGGTLRTDTREVYIGENSEQTNRFFNGTIDEVRIWNTARTAAQIRQNMHRTLVPGSESALVSYWKFNDASGSTAADSKGTNNGTLVGSPAWVTSTVPLGDATTVTSVLSFNGSSTTLGNISLSFTDTFDAPVDIVANEIPVVPSSYPFDASLFQGTRYWVINVYGSPGTFSANATFTYPSGELGSEATSRYSLFRRATGSDGSWTAAVSGAAALTATTITFNGVTSFSQFSVSSTSMIYQSSTVTQNTLALPAGATQQQVIGIEIQMAGTANPLSVTQFNLNSTGTTSLTDISNARLYYTGTSGTFATTTQYGSTIASPGASFNIIGSQALSSGTNYFWLTFDISSSAAGDNSIDAGCSQVTVDGIVRTPTVTAPAGSRQVINTAVPGSALSLNGVNQYVDLGSSSAFDLTSGFTVEAWIKVNSFSKDWQAVVTKGDHTWRLHRNFNTNFMGFGTNHNSVPDDLAGVTSVNDGQLHHVAAVYDGSNKYLYVDGRLDASSTPGGGLGTSTNAVFIGENSEAIGRQFNGMIDEVRIWNVARTATEIRTSMHRTLLGNEAGLVGYWQFNETSGDAFDLAGGHHGTILNGATRVPSGVPTGRGIVSTASGVTSGPATLGNISMTLSNAFDNPVDIVAYEMPLAPNAYPTLAAAFQGSRYWIIDVFGSPGIFSADVTFTYPSGELNTGLGSSGVSLYKRSSNSDGGWTSAVSGASIFTSTTVKFNGITSFSQFAVNANGMAYLSSTVTQNSAAVARATTQQQIIGIEVVTAGSSSPLSATAFNFSTNGTTSSTDISNARLYYTGASNTFAATGQFGSTVLSPNGIFSATGSQTLAEGTNYFWLTYDISPGATPGNSIDAECSLVTVGGIDRTPTVTAPSGSRLILDNTSPGSAISLSSGSSQYVEVADNDALDLTTSYTIEAWIRPNSFSSSAGIVSKYQTSGANGYVLRLTGPGPYTGVAFDELESNNGILSANQWYHIAGVNDNGTRTLYVNGVQVASSGTPLSVQANTDPLRIGNDFSGRYFDGQIDEVQIWSTARTASDIRSTMHRTLAGTESGLVGYWQFNEPSGIAIDLAHGYNGTLQNGAARTVSSVPVGGGTSVVVDNFTSGTANLGPISFVTSDAFDNQVQLVGTAISYKPSSFPSGISSVVDSNKYWVVSAFGSPGTFAGNLTLTFGGGGVTGSDQSSPSSLILFRRGSTATGAWESVTSATSANSSSGTVTFNGISSFSQFFVARDATPPSAVSFFPANNDTLNPTDNFLIVFSENVRAGVSGNITIYNGDNSIFEQIAANDSSRVTISHDTVTINPTLNLVDGRHYYVQIDNATITDIAGNGYAGISDATTWNFSVRILNYGGGGTGNGGYYFASSLAINAPSRPTFQWLTDTSNSLIVSLPSAGTNDDGYWGAIALPFSFPFFGSPQIAVYVGSNGILTFGAGTTAYVNVAIPSVITPNNFIAAFWDDMIVKPGISKIYYGGDASRFVVTYYKDESYQDTTQYVTAQVILYPSGSIKIQYNDSLTSVNRSAFINSCTIGIENSTGTLGVQYRFNGTGAPMFGSNLAVQFGLDASVLPVEMSSFTALARGLNAELHWTTTTETNNYGFEIERKAAAGLQPTNNWTKVGFAKGNGTSSSPHEYSFVDKTAQPGRYAYRIKQVDNNGAFKYSGAAEVEVGLAPKEFTLSQNYPNPFNPSTKILFTLPQDGRATLRVYNVLGQEVATLFDEEAQAGRFIQASFDAGRLASGIYFARLQYGSQQLMKKMLLVK